MTSLISSSRNASRRSLLDLQLQRLALGLLRALRHLGLGLLDLLPGIGELLVLLAQLQRVLVIGVFARFGTGAVLGGGKLILEQLLLPLRLFAGSGDLAVLFLQLQCDICRGTLARLGADALFLGGKLLFERELALLVLAAQ